MTIGARIREARKAQHITQKQLAKQTGIAEITIRNYEANKYKPKIEQLNKIADALNESLSYLMNGVRHYNEDGTETDPAYTTLVQKQLKEFFLKERPGAEIVETSDGGIFLKRSEADGLAEKTDVLGQPYWTTPGGADDFKTFSELDDEGKELVREFMKILAKKKKKEGDGE